MREEINNSEKNSQEQMIKRLANLNVRRVKTGEISDSKALSSPGSYLRLFFGNKTAKSLKRILNTD